MHELKTTRKSDRPIRLVVSDLDGTLLNQYNEISRDNYEAIMELKARGILFTIATGRLDNQARLYFEQLELDTPIISCNGALIRTGLSREILHLERMAPEMVMAMIHFVHENKIEYLLYDTDEVFYPVGSERISVYRNYNLMAERHSSQPCLITEIEMKRDLERVADRVCKIYLHSENPVLINACREFVKNHTNLLAVSSVENNLDIAPPRQTKGNAVNCLARHYGLQREEVCVFGDNDNDASMLYEAGLAFAMQNGSEMAKTAADFIAPSNTVSGVGRAIRQFLL